MATLNKAVKLHTFGCFNAISLSYCMHRIPLTSSCQIHNIEKTASSHSSFCCVNMAVIIHLYTAKVFLLKQETINYGLLCYNNKSVTKVFLAITRSYLSILSDAARPSTGQ